MIVLKIIGVILIIVGVILYAALILMAGKLFSDAVHDARKAPRSRYHDPNWKRRD